MVETSASRAASAGPDSIPDIPASRHAPKKVDVLGQQSDGAKLAAALPAAIVIPEEATPWVQVRHTQGLVTGH